MDARTDLAVELGRRVNDATGLSFFTRQEDDIVISEIVVENELGSRNIGKPIGRYINLDVPSFAVQGGSDGHLERLLNECLTSFHFPTDDWLVVGLGNRHITPDTLGPATADGILATRHLSSSLRRQTGLGELRNVSVLLPGVLGQTGVETAEIVKGVAASCKAKAVLVIDAFAAADPSRLGTTIQLCDSGISPGSGVGNNRREISRNTLGIPVLAIGVPTCVDAADLVRSMTKGAPVKEPNDMIVTPREIDLLIDRAAAVLARAINCFLQPETDPTLLLSVV